VVCVAGIGYARDKEVLILGEPGGVPAESMFVSGIGEGRSASRFWIRAWFDEIRWLRNEWVKSSEWPTA